MSTYDFIVVGAGPSGASCAALLAKSAKAPKVLLLEAGDSTADRSARVLFDRFTTFMTNPHLDYGYLTVPQKQFKGRQVGYSRGKGLGGSSLINFACYTVGPSDDYDEWAELVGDESFKWKSVRNVFNRIETFHRPNGDTIEKYANPGPDHGTTGPLSVEYSTLFEKDVTMLLDQAGNMGWEVVKDMNDGNPIGIGVSPSTAHKGIRYTAATAYLQDPPANLTITAAAQIKRIILDNGRATGVEAVTGDKYYASKEVIISCGSLDTPKLLKLSGIGPKDELTKHGIETLVDLPGVGENLQDHIIVPLSAELKQGSTDRWKITHDSDLLSSARAEFLKEGTGPLAYALHSIVFGWLKDEPLLSSAEFKKLNPRVQKHMLKPTVPTWEIIGPTTTLHPNEDASKSYISFLAALMNPQSIGRVTLASANPADAPLCNPEFCAHPFDRLNLINAMRQCLNFLGLPEIEPNIVANFNLPKSKSDEDIWSHIQDNAISEWHMSGTAKMGKEEDKTAVTDNEFKVRGVKGLRVVDLSVCPFVLNCHTVAVAYLMGAMGAGKIGKEHGLDG